MLESLVILDSFVFDVYMEDIADIKCQLRRLRLEKKFIKKISKIIAEFSVSITFSLIKLI